MPAHVNSQAACRGGLVGCYRCCDTNACLVSAVPVLLVLLVLLWQPTRAAPQLQSDTQWSGKKPELFIVPMLINGREERGELVLAIDPTSGTEFIELDAAAQALNISLSAKDTEVELQTPIGSTMVQAAEWRLLDGKRMVPIELLGQRLASPMRFDRQVFAVTVELAWTPGARIAQSEIITPEIEADVTAGAASVSFLRSEILHRDPRGGSTTTAVTDTGGNLLGGFWQARVRDYLEDDPFVEDYVWVRSSGNRRYFLGNQTTSLTTLLGGFEFSGAQMAWTNRDIGIFTQGVNQGELINNQRGSIRTFIGEGPPGGLAELRIEDRPLARDVIALDGRYEFRDVELATGTVVKIEVWVFERGSEGAPLKIDDFSGFNTNLTLPGGTFLARTGAGVDGNLIEDNGNELNAAGFADLQYALNDRLTAQAIYQLQDQIDTGFAALHANFDRLGFISGQIGHADGATAWRIELDNRQQHLFWRGFATHLPAGWQGREDEFDDIFLESGYRFNQEWEFSLVGRNQESDVEDVDFLLPAAQWRPGGAFLLRARPDFDGDYTVQAFWRIGDDHDLSAIFNENESNVQWVWQFDQRDSLFVQAIDRDVAGERLSAIWRRAPSGTRSLGFAIGGLIGNGAKGFLLQADYEFIPGLRARGELLRDPFTKLFDQPADTVFTVSLVADFNLGGGVSRGAFRRALADRGVVAGSIELPPAAELQGFDLSGVAIMVDGQVRTRTESNGSFTIQFMPPGLYRVKLDLDGLPLELVPMKDQFWVRVSAGAVTRVNYLTELRLGFAGQVQGQGGCGLPATALEVLDSAGDMVARVLTNQFGFYRVDGLAPGRYRIRIGAAPDTAVWVQLSNDFAFGQNINTSLECPVMEDEP